MHITDLENWKQICNGNVNAYELLYNKYSKGMFIYGMRLIQNKFIVNEAIQAVFVNLYKYRKRLSTPKFLRSYLYKALKNEIIIIRRADKTSKKVDYSDDILNKDSFEFGLEIDFESMDIKSELEKDSLIALNESINKLSSRQKEAIYLRYYNNLSGEEIAEIMNINHQSVRSTLTKALTKLRDNLGANKSLEYALFILFVHFINFYYV